MTVTQSTLLLGKYKRIGRSCPRVLHVSLSCFPGVLLNIRPWEAWEGMLGILVLDLRTMIVVYWVSVCEMYGAGWVSVCEMYGASSAGLVFVRCMVPAGLVFVRCMVPAQLGYLGHMDVIRLCFGKSCRQSFLVNQIVV